MAISFRPFGPSGGYPHTESLVVATGATIAIGDPVIYNGSGLIAVGTATSPSFAGVAASSCSSAAAGTEIDVYNDPDQEFLVACSGTPTQAMAGNFVDVEGTTGAFECNENASTYRVVQIVGFAPGESTGSGASVRVKIARHATEADESGTTYGDLVGDVTGDVSGDLTGDVLADDGNQVVTSGATVAASSIDAGSIAGDLTGDVLADDAAAIVTSGASVAASSVSAGSLAGALTGNVSGNVTGDVLADDANPIVTSGATVAASSIDVGTIAGALTGDVAGDLTGDVLADDAAAILTSGANVAGSSLNVGTLAGALTGDVAGDVTGNVLADDTNPIVTSGATVAASSIDVGTIAGALTGAVTGDVTGNVLADDTNPIVTSGATTAASSIAVGSAVLSGDLSIGGHIDGVEVNCNPLPTNPSTEWGFIAKYFSHVPQSQSAVVLYCQPQLAIGDEIVGARVSGTALENNAITLDAALVSVAQDGTESVLTATTGFTQVDANGDFTGSWSLDAVETVAINKNCFVKLTATTGATDTISVLAVTVTKNAKC